MNYLTALIILGTGALIGAGTTFTYMNNNKKSTSTDAKYVATLSCQVSQKALIDYVLKKTDTMFTCAEIADVIVKEQQK